MDRPRAANASRVQVAALETGAACLERGKRMKHYDDLIERMRGGTGLPLLAALLNECADAVEELRSELNTCRNELCLRCVSYKTAHMGSCDGCRWKDNYA